VTVLDNTGIATAFLRMCARGDVREAYEAFVAPEFVHHNPWFPETRASLLRAMQDSAVAEPNKAFDVMQVVDGGERVAVLSRLLRAAGAGEYAVVHILRIVDGRIVELWDLAHPVPVDSPNRLGVF
jgi:predicted SnoaL-like aldol condensation-catalyzing enzyme